MTHQRSPRSLSGLAAVLAIAATRVLFLAGAAVGDSHAPHVSTQDPAGIQNDVGLQLLVVPENAQPALRIVLSSRRGDARAWR